jgi:hypothetical protein
MKESNQMRHYKALVAPVLMVAAMCSWSGQSHANVVVIEADRDTTLIESSSGEYGNGAGPAFFVGRTSQRSDSIRRGLIAFDLSDSIPAGSLVLAATLELELTSSHDAEAVVSLHRVDSAWGEGASSASGGRGAPAQVGDATWYHRFFDDEFWSLPGGDFATEPSASSVVAGSGLYAWHSNPELVADVQSWADVAEDSHGWVVIGDESQPTTTKRFASREAEPAEDGKGSEIQPRLTVEFVPPCGSAELERAPAALCHAYCQALRCEDENPRGTTRACDRLAFAFMRKTGGIPPVCGALTDEP